MVIAFSDLRNAYPKIMKVVCFPSKVLRFYLLHSVYDFLNSFLCMVSGRVSCHLSHQNLLVKKTFPLHYFAGGVLFFFPTKSILIRVALFLDSLFCLLDLWNPIPKPQCRNYGSLMVLLEFG